MTEPSDSPAPDLSRLPPLRDVITRHRLWSRKALGQHFLLDRRTTDRIAAAAGDLSPLAVIEIGPGPGGLTRSLLARGPRSLIAVERDRRCVAALRELEAAAAGRLTVVEADALTIEPTSLVPAPRAIVANLPYNIATPLLLGWLRQIDAFASLTLMFQKEVADRLTAAPGGKDYGRLSVVTQWRAEVRRLLTLRPGAFWPAPKVQSAVVQVLPRPDPMPAAWQAIERVTAAAFGQRRKMLRQSLKALGDVERLLTEAGLPPTARAEDVDVAGFVRLARALSGEK